MNFGFIGDTLLLHSSKVGKKIDILLKNPDVCVVFSTDHQLRWQSEKVACSWSMKYRSVLAYGKVEFVNNIAEKETLLTQFMKNYSSRDFTFSKPALEEVQLIKVPIHTFEGRAYGY